MNEIYCTSGLTDCEYKSSTGNCTYTGRGCARGLDRSFKYNLVGIIRHGHWVEVPDEVFASTYYCSECKGEAIPDIYGKYLLSNWCYYCGAKMDEVKE